MKITCLSDTQIPSEELKEYLEGCRTLFLKSDKIVFLGDGIRNLKDFLSDYKDVAYVKGNHDNNDYRYPSSLKIETQGLRLLFIHGNRDQKVREQFNIWENKIRFFLRLPLNLQSYYWWLYKKYLGRADIVVYGHMHIPKIEQVNKTIFFCPGGFPPRRLQFGHPPSLGVIEINEQRNSIKKIVVFLYTIDKNSKKPVYLFKRIFTYGD